MVSTKPSIKGTSGLGPKEHHRAFPWLSPTDCQKPAHNQHSVISLQDFISSLELFAWSSSLWIPMVRKISQFSRRKRVFSTYGYGEEPANMNFKGSKPRRHLGVIYVCDSGFMVFQCWGLATQPALFYEVKWSWNPPNNGKSLVTSIQLVPALLRAAAVCKRTLISCAAPCACPSPASRCSGRVCGQRNVCAYKPLVDGGGGIPGTARKAWGWQGRAWATGSPSPPYGTTRVFCTQAARGACTCMSLCLPTRSSGPG